MNQIILPGEKLIFDQSQSQKLNFSYQFQINEDSMNNNLELTSYQAGNLISKRIKKKQLIMIENTPNQYFEILDDFVIGIIKYKMGEFYVVDIGSPCDCLLNIFEFQGATKKNRPHLEKGMLIYCRVIEKNKFLRTQLSCISKTNKKEWMTGQSFFGQLKDGLLLQSTPKLSQKLLDQSKLNQNENENVLKEIAKYIEYDICIGLNGKIWIKSQKIQNQILIMNLLKFYQQCKFNTMETYNKIMQINHLFIK